MKLFLANLFFFFSLMPFISPYPLATDVQPVSILFGSLLLFWRFLEKSISLDYLSFCFIMIAFFSLFYSGFDPQNNFEPRYRFSLLFAFITFLTTFYYFKFFSTFALKAAIYLNFFGIIWHFFSPETFQPLAENIVRTIKDSAGGRGVSGFAAEPSFNSITALVQIVISYYFWKNNKISSSSLFILISLCLLIILLTGSGTGYLLTFFLFGIYFLSQLSFKRLLSIIILLPVISIIFLNSSYSDSRGGQIIKVLFTNPSVILMDGSVSERMLAIEIGYRSLQLNPFGNGGGSYEKAANQVNDKFNLVNKYENQGITGDRGNRYLKDTVSSFSRYSIELGLIFFFFISYLIYYCTRPKLYSFLSIPLALILILVSFSIIFPPIYLLLVSSLHQKKES
jgi:hypothetical protein